MDALTLTKRTLYNKWKAISNINVMMIYWYPKGKPLKINIKIIINDFYKKPNEVKHLSS